jgi:hypothetical protein
MPRSKVPAQPKDVKKPTTRDITPERWAQIVAIYARHAGRVWPAAMELGWPVARTRRIYHKGYPSCNLPPIKEILAEDAKAAEQIRAERQRIADQLPPSAPLTTIEQVVHRPEVLHVAESARIAQMVRREKDREKAREDAVRSKAEEAMMISINRRNAIALNGVTAQIMKGAMALSGAVQAELEKEAASGTLSVKERLQLVRSAANIMRFNSEATMLAVKAERMVLGQPLDTSGDDVTDDGSMDQAVQWIDSAARAIERARARGLLVSSTEKSEH